MQGLEIFFKYLFGPSVKGYVCLAQLSKSKEGFKEHFFKWPDQLDDMINYVGKYTFTHNLYLCPQILNTKVRRKEHVIACPTAWADLDECSPDECIVPPTISLETSEGRFQAYWRFEDPLEPEEAEALSRKIAYYHSFQGADRSGWDLTQLLRVPYTHNYDHGREDEIVKVLSITTNKYRESDFDKYPAITKEVADDIPMPEGLEGKSGEDILDKYA